MPARWRRGRDWTLLVAALFLADACTVTLGFVAAGDTVLRPLLTSPAGLYYQELTAVMVPVFLLIFAWQRLYDPVRLLRGGSELSSVVRSCVYGLVVLVLIGFAQKHQVSRQWTVWSCIVAGLLVAGERSILRLIVRRLQRGGHFVTRALLIGADAQSVAVARQLGGPNSGFLIVGVLDDYHAQGTVVAHGLRVLGGSRALSQIAARTGATEAIVVPQALPWETLQTLLAEAMAADGVRLHLSAGFYDLLTAGVTLTERNHVPLATVERVALTPFEAAVKRTFDCLLAIFLLVVLSPAYAFTAVRLARRNRGGVLERRPVVGRDGRTFELLAFRAVPLLRYELVRKLPGLLNVLRGELSIVGPRPLPAGSARQTGPQRLGNLRPGLTGLWRRADDPTEQQILDLYYIRGYSIWLDLQVLLGRVRARIGRRRRSESQPAVQRVSELRAAQPIPTSAPRVPDVVVATTYPEAAVLAIAEAAAREGRLDNLYTTVTTSDRTLRLVRRLPAEPIRRRIQAELNRRSLSGIPPARIKPAAAFPELSHRAVRLFPRSETLAQHLENSAKARFDSQVAVRVRRTQPRVVIAMSGSAERTLLAANEVGALPVLHLVNSHPTHLNRNLRDLANLKTGDHELVPAAVVGRLTRELEIADLILVPSCMVAEQLRAEGIPAHRVIRLAFGVDPEEFHPVDKSRNFGEPLRCLFVGSICARKGVAELLQAARLLRHLPVTFTLVGPLRKRDLFRALPDNSRWLGGRPHSEVAELMRRSDVLVLPSLDDAYPLVTMEAMASGLPVVVSDRCGTAELITEGVDGFVVPAGSVRALVQAIESLLDDRTAVQRMGLAARSRIESGPTWHDYGRTVLENLTPSPDWQGVLAQA